MQITTGKYHTLLINDNSVYSCGSSYCGVLGHPGTTQLEALTRVNFPSKSCVIHVSASHNHAAFVMQSGEVSTVRKFCVCILAWWNNSVSQHLIQVFTCGDNSSFCCGLGDARRTIVEPTRVEALKGIPCKQVRHVLLLFHPVACGINVSFYGKHLRKVRTAV